MTQISNTSAAPFGSNTFRCPEAHDHCPCRKGEQTLAGFLQDIGDSAVLEPPLAEEGLATDFPIPIFRNEINALGDFKGGVKVARDFAMLGQRPRRDGRYTLPTAPRYAILSSHYPRSACSASRPH